MTHAISGEPAFRPLGSLANRQGRTLANVLAGRTDRFPPVAGAAAIKVFELNVACVGLTAVEAKKYFPDARAVWTSPHDRAHYWPGAKDIFLQLVFNAESRRVLGVQAVGPGECAKRVDVATQLLVHGANLAEFTQLEHAYAPAYAPAMEPLAQAAMVAENLLMDGCEFISPLTDLARPKLLDVRHDFELEDPPLTGGEVLAIDQGELRGRLHDLPKVPYTTVCVRGLRSAEAARLLQSQGLEAGYLAGGLAWLMAAGLLGEDKD